MKRTFFNKRSKQEKASGAAERTVPLAAIRHNHLTRSSSVGLGRDAVASLLHETDDELKGVNNSEDDYVAQLNAGLVKPQRIQRIRDRLVNLATDDAQFLYGKTKGAFIRDAIFYDKYDDNSAFYDTQPQPFSSRLQEKQVNPETGAEEFVVGNETLLSFVQWYMAQTIGEQKKLDAKIDGLKLEYKDVVVDTIRQGQLPDRVYEALLRIDKVDVLHDDMFATDASDGKGQSMAGWYKYRPRLEVAVSPKLDEVQFKETLTHELTHALSNDHTARYGRRKLLGLHFGREYGAKVFNEMLTEHLSQSLLYGDFTTIDPDKRSSSGVYVLYRQFFDMLANGGLHNIEPGVFYDALYFTQQESADDFINDEKVNKLLHAIEASFPGVDVNSRILACRSDKDLRELMDDMQNSVAARDKSLVLAAQHWGREFDEK